MVPGGVLTATTCAGATAAGSTFSWLGGATPMALAWTAAGVSLRAADGAFDPFCDVRPYATPIPTSATTTPAKTMRVPLLPVRIAGTPTGVAGVTVLGSMGRTAGASVGAC